MSVTAAAIFANLDKFLMLVELFKMFLPERKDKSIDEFKGWLISHNHNQIVDVLNNENQLADYLANLINDKTGTLEEQLKEINKMVTSIYASTQIFAPMATELKIDPELSKQAISILEKSKEYGFASFIIYISDSRKLVFNFDLKTSFNVPEDCFLDDDLLTLTTMGLLIKSSDKNGNDLYRPTRLAMSLLELLPKEEE